MKKLLIISIVFVLLTVCVIAAPNPGHDLSSIGSGTASCTTPPCNNLLYGFPGYVAISRYLTISEYLTVGGQAEVGGFKMTTGAVACGDGCVLTSDGTGVGAWEAATGGLTGSGQDNYLARWDGTNALQNSAVYVTDTGRVGIGTNNPQSALHTMGTLIAEVSGGGDQNILCRGACSTNNKVVIRKDSELWYLAPWGTDANANIIAIGGGSGLGNSVGLRVHGPTSLATNTGNVGIGTNTPSEKLEVEGNVKIGGYINSDSGDVIIRLG